MLEGPGQGTTPSQVTIMRKCMLVFFLGFGLCLFGCDSDEASTDDGAGGGGSAGGGGDEGGGNGAGGDGGGDPDTGPDPSNWGSPDEGNDWRIIFNYRGRVGEAKGTNELWLMTQDGGEKLRLTELADLENVDPPLSCEYGCFIDQDLEWLAIAIGPPTADGFSFRIGKFTNPSTLEFKLIKDLVLADNIDFKFAGDRLYFSKRATCAGASCQYDISFIDLNTSQTTKIITFPPDTDLEQSTYKGHFKVSQDGSKLVMLNTTIRSVGVYLWKDGSGLIKLDFLCKFGTEGNCQGTGSEYNDTDPVAISPNNDYAVFFSFADRFQVARTYDLNAPGEVTVTFMASVPTGSYIEHMCDFGQLSPWQWPLVVGDPLFNPTGDEILFLTEDDCPAPNGTQPAKRKRNLMRVRLDTLTTGGTLTQDQVFNVTQNPGGDVTDNILITGYALSKDGGTIVLTGTPTFDQSGEKLMDTSSRHRNDREVYRMRYDGANVEQLTNDPSWEATSPRIVPPAP